MDACENRGKTCSLEHETGADWQLAIESAGHGYWDINLKTGYRFLSPNWYRLRGLVLGDTESPLFDAWISRVHPDDLESLVAMVRSVEDGLTDVIRYEYRERHRAGHYIWLLSNGRVVSRNADGKMVRAVGTDTDITAVKAVSTGLHVLTHRHKLAMEASNIGVWEFDPKTYETVWDENTMRLFQVTQQELLDHRFWQKVVHPDDLEALEAASAEAVRDRASYTFDYRITPKDGVMRHVRTRAAYYDDAIGGSKLIGVVWDVTAEVTRAAELARAKELTERQNQELVDAWARIEWDASHDALTGLANRRQVDAKLASIVAGDHADRVGRVAVFHVDLDRFKQVNDSYGHAAGDAVLKHAATALTSAFPSSALISRTGGDEFVIVLEGDHPDALIMTFAEAASRGIASPFQYGEHTLLVGGCIGVATAACGTESGEQLLLNADIALYRAKAAGQSRIRMFHKAMQQPATQRAA